MIEPRLQKITALLDDCRSLLVDIVDDGPTTSSSVKDFNYLDSARQFINSSIVYCQMADSDVPTAAREHLQ